MGKLVIKSLFLEIKSLILGRSARDTSLEDQLAVDSGTSPYSKGPLIQRFYSPTFLWSEGSIVWGFYSPKVL